MILAGKYDKKIAGSEVLIEKVSSEIGKKLIK